MSTQREEQRRKEALRRVKRIEIVTRRTVNDVLAGAYHSVYKGQGIEFDTVRKYEPGDDIRAIDWNVSARMGEPFVKVFQEERELTVMLLVDVSASQGFGTSELTKSELSAELAALLAFSAIQNNDKVGAILFSDRIEKFIPPDRGRKHVLRVISQILTFQPQGAKTSIAKALEYFLSLKIRRTVSFLISDFQDAGYERQLALAAKKHDLVAFCIEDPLEKQLPKAGLVRMHDPETGAQTVVDLSHEPSRKLLIDLHNHYVRMRTSTLSRAQVDNIAISTDTKNRPYIVPLVTFFRRRAKRK